MPGSPRFPARSPLDGLGHPFYCSEQSSERTFYSTSDRSCGLRGFQMLFAIVLGTIIGGAGVTLLGQWAHSAFEFGEPRDVITSAAFPRLALSERAPRYMPRLWNRAA